MTMKHKFLSMMAAAIVGLAVNLTANPAHAADVVKYGTLRVMTPVFIGIKKGYFAEQNIKIELQYFRSGAEVVPSLSRGLVDAAGTAVGAALFNAMGRGVKIKIVGDYLTFRPGVESHALVVRQQLIDSGAFKSLKDLKGKKIAITAVGQFTWLAALKALERGGLSQNDATLVNMRYPDMFTALKNGAVDAAALLEPFISRVTKLGIGKPVAQYPELTPDTQMLVYMYGENISKNKDLGVRLMKALIKCNEYVLKVSKDPSMRPEFREIMNSFLKRKNPKIYETMKLPLPAEDPHVNAKSLEAQLAFYDKHRLVRQKPNLGEFIDQRFVDGALGK